MKLLPLIFAYPNTLVHLCLPHYVAFWDAHLLSFVPFTPNKHLTEV